MTEKITKTFRRLIKTGDFESVEVISTDEIVIEYTNDADRDEQISEFSDRLTTQLIEDVNMILEKLGLEEKRVFVKSNRPRPVGV